MIVVPILSLFVAAIWPHSVVMKRDIPHLLSLLDRYRQVTGLSDARVSTKILNSSRFFGRLRNGGDCTTRNYERVHAWLVANLGSDCGYIAATEGTMNQPEQKGNRPKIRTKRYFICIPPFFQSEQQNDAALYPVEQLDRIPQSLPRRHPAV
jgi:hypothetical protein